MVENTMTSQADVELAPEGGYFMSLSDLLIGVLFLFIILLIGLPFIYKQALEEARAGQEALEQLEPMRKEVETLRGDLQAREERVRSLVDDLKTGRAKMETQAERIAELELRTTRLENHYEAVRKFLEKISTQLRSKGIHVSVDKKENVLRFEDKLLFVRGEFLLSPEGHRALSYLADILEAELECYAGRSSFGSLCPEGQGVVLEAILIEGHTDAVPVSGGRRYSDNWELSTLRAVNTFRSLVEGHVSLAAAKNADGAPLIAVSGYGEQRLLVKTNPEDDLNRRIDLRFLISPGEPREVRVPSAQEGGDH